MNHPELGPGPGAQPIPVTPENEALVVAAKIEQAMQGHTLAAVFIGVGSYIASLAVHVPDAQAMGLRNLLRLVRGAAWATYGAIKAEPDAGTPRS